MDAHYVRNKLTNVLSHKRQEMEGVRTDILKAEERIKEYQADFDKLNLEAAALEEAIRKL